MCDTYNGWKNRETWATMLYIDNDEGLQNAVYEAVRERAKTGDKYECAITVREMVEELLDMENLFSAPAEQRQHLIVMSTDIGSLYRVNWLEISNSILESTVA